MKNFDKLFAEAVKMLLEQKEQKSDKQKIAKIKDEKTDDAKSMIEWKAGQGNWSDVIKGLKKEVTYDEAIQSSAAKFGNLLMKKLNINEQANDKDDPLEAAHKILNQAIKNKEAMSELYEMPRLSGRKLSIGVKLSMNPEDVASGEGITPRNATVFIHLTLLGAYNAGFMNIKKKIRITTANPDSSEILILSV